MKKVQFILMLFIVVLLSNCTEYKDDFVFMYNLKNNISETYNIDDIDIEIIKPNDIKITLTNSRFNDYASDKKQKLANEIGKIVKELRVDMTKIKSGKLLFVNETDLKIINIKEADSFNIF